MSACIGVPIVAPVVSPGTAIEKPAIVHCATANLSEIVPGRVQAPCGEASLHYCLEAIAQAKQGELEAIVTCPISKEALALVCAARSYFL